jgi:hypothetical protein
MLGSTPGRRRNCRRHLLDEATNGGHVKVTSAFRKESAMPDLLFVALACICFAVSIAYLTACGKL